MPVPREHGAWFMLGHCLLIGALVSGHALATPVLLVVAASFLMFMGVAGIRQIARRGWSARRGAGPPLAGGSIVLLVVASVTWVVAAVAYDRAVLFVWGGVGIVLAAVYGWVVARRQDRSTLGEWLGILGLTAATGSAWSAGTGRLLGDGVSLWCLAFLHFGGSVPYVKFRVKQLKDRGGSITTHAALARAPLAHALGSLAAAAVLAVRESVGRVILIPFLLSLGKVLWCVVRARGPLRIAHVGYAEVAFSTVFTVLTIAAFWSRS